MLNFVLEAQSVVEISKTIFLTFETFAFLKNGTYFRVTFLSDSVSRRFCYYVIYGWT